VEPEYCFENKDPKLESRQHRFFLFLDFDGTLAPIQNDLKKCVLSPGMKGYLEAISLSGNASIAILSGRTVNDVKKRSR
jgi:trehalose-phosphatase